MKALIIRDFSGVEPRLYHEAIAAQAVACPRTQFNVERQFASPTTGDTPKTSSERSLPSPTTSSQKLFDPRFTSTQADEVSSDRKDEKEKSNDSEEFFQSSVSYAKS